MEVWNLSSSLILNLAVFLGYLDTFLVGNYVNFDCYHDYLQAKLRHQK